LSVFHFINPVCIPPSIEAIQPRLFEYLPSGRSAVAFELGSQLRHVHTGSFFFARLRSLCVPASVQVFDGIIAFHSALEIVTFESPSQSASESAPSAGTDYCTDLFGSPTFSVGRGNPHFTVSGQSLMNFTRTRLIAYGSRSDSDVTIGATVEELGGGAFCCLSIMEVTFAGTSRLREIGISAFAGCPRLKKIVLPSSVEVIRAHAFAGCACLEQVRFARGSRLQQIDWEVFFQCPFLEPVDVPSQTIIAGDFTILDRFFDEDGSEHIRVRFPTPDSYP
jgi:hypothetical protein